MRRRVLRASLGLNLLLGIALAAAWGWRVASGGAAGPKAVPASGAMASSRSTSDSSGAGPSRTRIRTTPWSGLQSDDPRILAENLRNAGCPEQTVCDLVLPAVNRWFDRRRGEIGRKDSFWVTGRARAALRERHTAALRALSDDKVGMIRALTCGFDFKEGERDLEVFALIEFFSGFLGPVKQQALLQFALEQESRRELTGDDPIPMMGLAEDLQAEKRSVDEIRSRLDQMLTRAERRELDLRLSLLRVSGLSGGEDLGRLHLTATEMKEFVRIQSRIEGSMLEELFRADRRMDPPRSSEEDVEPALRALLGDARFALYQRLKDPVHLRVEALANAAKLPVELADQTYEIATGFAADLAPIRTTWDANPDEARRTLMAWRAAQRGRLEALLAGIPEGERKGMAQMAVDEAIRAAWRKR